MQPKIVRPILCKIALLIAFFYAITLTAQENSSTPDSPGYTAMTGKERFTWFAKSTVGPQSLAAGLFTAALGTAANTPKEYGPHWEGFGKRYGIRLSGVSTSNAMEAGLGTFWGEDPKYYPTKDLPIKGRIVNVMKTTFTAPRPDGHYAPAYARFIAISGSNFLSNTWRADSEADAQHAAMRTLYGFLGHMGGEAFQEFWPDVQKRIFHKK
jgi:hypothetical protein